MSADRHAPGCKPSSPGIVSKMGHRAQDSILRGWQWLEMLAALNREGRTIIMVTHEHDIADWAKRQIVMRDGVVHKETRTKPV